MNADDAAKASAQARIDLAKQKEQREKSERTQERKEMDARAERLIAEAVAAGKNEVALDVLGLFDQSLVKQVKAAIEKKGFRTYESKGYGLDFYWNREVPYHKIYIGWGKQKLWWER